MAGNLKVNSVQLGDSATATQNFVWITNVDGTCKLARGNVGATSQDILTVNAAGIITFNQGLALFPARTWQTVTRASGTTYTAPAYDIVLTVSGNTSGNNVQGSATINVGGTGAFTFALAGGGAVAQCGIAGTTVIPANATYVLTFTNTTAMTVSELR